MRKYTNLLNFPVFMTIFYNVQFKFLPLTVISKLYRSS